MPSDRAPPCGHPLSQYDITMHSPAYQQIECMVCGWVIREGPRSVAYSGPPEQDPWREPASSPGEGAA